MLGAFKHDLSMKPGSLGVCNPILLLSAFKELNWDIACPWSALEIQCRLKSSSRTSSLEFTVCSLLHFAFLIHEFWFKADFGSWSVSFLTSPVPILWARSYRWAGPSFVGIKHTHLNNIQLQKRFSQVLMFNKTPELPSATKERLEKKKHNTKRWDKKTLFVRGKGRIKFQLQFCCIAVCYSVGCSCRKQFLAHTAPALSSVAHGFKRITFKADWGSFFIVACVYMVASL